MEFIIKPYEFSKYTAPPFHPLFLIKVELMIDALDESSKEIAPLEYASPQLMKVVLIIETPVEFLKTTALYASCP